MDSKQITGSRNRILSAEQIERVHELSLDLLERTGCSVQCAEALEILGQAGCDTHDPQRVKFPRRTVEAAIEVAPKRIEVFNRRGEAALILAEDSCYYGTGSDCSTTIDPGSGQRRLCTKRDVGALARLCGALPNIDFVMSFGIAHDTPDGSDFVHQYEAMLLNTEKPCIVTGHGRNDMDSMIDMAAAAVGGREALAARPPLILYSEPFSPLVHTDMGAAKALICCETGVPFIYIGSPMMGATGPASLEGALVQAVAESLSGLVIFQNKQPGAKFIFGADASVFDMSSAQYSYGAPELNVLNAAVADMAHHYRLPFFCIAGASDAKTLDAQAGLEYALSIYNATLNGCNLIHDCGYLESGMTSSFESVLFADEIIGLVKHMLRPLVFDDTTVPLDLMNDVGPGGHFLQEEHTLRHFRSAFWFPRFLDRKNHEQWQKAGSLNLRERLREKARDIYESHPAPLPPDRVAEEIRRISAGHRPDLG